MKKNLTELVFILDKSGSMSGLESDTIGGYNSMLAQQRKVDGACVITTVLFDNRYELLHGTAGRHWQDDSQNCLSPEKYSQRLPGG